MRRLAVLLSLLLIVLGHRASVWAQPGSLTSTEIPAEIIDLCRILKDQIINRGVAVGVDHDILGMPRPSGGGVDIGAIECDSGSTEPPGHGLVSLRLEVTPSAPQACHTVRWTVQGDTARVVTVRLYLRAPDGGYALGSPAVEHPGVDASMVCTGLPRPPMRSWLVIATAVDAHGQDLATSNEVELLFDPFVVVTLPPRPQADPVSVKDVAAPPDLLIMPRVPRPPPTGGASLSESCLWNSCQPSALPRTIPPGFGQGGSSLGDSAIWNSR